MMARANLQGAFAFALACCVLPGASRADVTRPVLRLTAEQRYDDDVLLRPEQPGLLPGQVLTKVTPRLGVKREGPTGTEEAWYAADAMYRESTGVARLDHRAALGLKRSLSSTVRAAAELKLYRVSDPTSLPRLGVARTLAPVAYGKGTAELSVEVAPRWTVRPSVQAEAVQVLDKGTPFGAVYSPALEGWWRAAPRDAFALGGRWQAFTWGHEASSAANVFGGYRRDLTPGLSLTARAGPTFFTSARGDGRVVPRLTVELAQERETADVGMVAGTDLVGASGFNDALWAQFASAFANWHPVRALRLYGVASFFRNGPATTAWWPGGTAAEGVGSGYAVEGGVDWSWSRFANVQGAFTRLSQLGNAEADWTRNIVAVRLVLHPAQ